MTDEKPTDLLRDEHASVMQKLDALERIVLHPESRPEIIAELKALAAFFRSDFWVHFTKEEEALFLEMGRFTLIDRGPLGVMLREHEELRNSNDRLQGAVNGYLADTGSIESTARMKEHGTHFIWMLRDHIKKEDNMLFAMAEMWLDATQKLKVTKLFQKIEAEHHALPKQA